MAVDRETYTKGYKWNHSYEVEVFAHKDARIIKDFSRKTFEVHATNRNQAARRVERDGYEVCSVNMIG